MPIESGMRPGRETGVSGETGGGGRGGGGGLDIGLDILERTTDAMRRGPSTESSLTPKKDKKKNH
ncbi:hypothetical protein QF028_003469 [Neobacillus sp. B4I6]|uniref:hypothetical protein n=1 Tax=Neobacillus sp. B4I6 TaxID=3373925 RepID=UPI003D209F09